MAINWPATPSPGTTVTGPRGQVWEWDGLKWIAGGAGGPGSSVPIGPFVASFNGRTGAVALTAGDITAVGGATTTFVATAITNAIAASKIGVTDGSEVAAGQIGEFLSGEAGLPYPGYPGATNGVVSVLTVPPGDWEFRAWLRPSGDTDFAWFALQPVPTGMLASTPGTMGDPLARSYGLHGTVLTPALGGPPGAVPTIASSGARGNFKVPTAMSFFIAVNNSVTPGFIAGTATVHLEARRTR